MVIMDSSHYHFEQVIRVWMGGGGLVFTIHKIFSPLFIS